MTVRYTADVFCDRCGNWVAGATGDKSSGLATKAVKAARWAGWSRVKNSMYLDLCPSCVNEYRRDLK